MHSYQVLHWYKEQIIVYGVHKDDFCMTLLKPGSMMMPMVHVSIEGHTLGLTCSLGPCWCPKATLLLGP